MAEIKRKVVVNIETKIDQESAKKVQAYFDDLSKSIKTPTKVFQEFSWLLKRQENVLQGQLDRIKTVKETLELLQKEGKAYSVTIKAPDKEQLQVVEDATSKAVARGVKTGLKTGLATVKIEGTVVTTTGAAVKEHLTAKAEAEAAARRKNLENQAKLEAAAAKKKGGMSNEGTYYSGAMFGSLYNFFNATTKVSNGLKRAGESAGYATKQVNRIEYAFGKYVLGMKEADIFHGRYMEGLRKYVTGLLITQHVLRVLGQYSQVVNKSVDALGKTLGYMLDYMLLPMLPVLMLFVNLGMGIVSVFKWITNVLGPLGFVFRDILAIFAFGVVAVLAYGGALLMRFVTQIIRFIFNLPTLINHLNNLNNQWYNSKRQMEGLANESHGAAQAIAQLTGEIGGLKRITNGMLDVPQLTSGNIIYSGGVPEYPRLPSGGSDYQDKNGRWRNSKGRFIRRAIGGPLSLGQTAIVGERGPEILLPTNNGFHVIPNHAIRGLAEGTNYNTTSLIGGGIAGGIGGGLLASAFGIDPLFGGAVGGAVGVGLASQPGGVGGFLQGVGGAMGSVMKDPVFQATMGSLMVIAGTLSAFMAPLQPILGAIGIVGGIGGGMYALSKVFSKGNAGVQQSIQGAAKGSNTIATAQLLLMRNQTVNLSEVTIGKLCACLGMRMNSAGSGIPVAAAAPLVAAAALSLPNPTTGKIDNTLQAQMTTSDGTKWEKNNRGVWNAVGAVVADPFTSAGKSGEVKPVASGWGQSMGILDNGSADPNTFWKLAGLAGGATMFKSALGLGGLLDYGSLTGAVGETFTSTGGKTMAGGVVAGAPGMMNLNINVTGRNDDEIVQKIIQQFRLQSNRMKGV